MNEQTRQGAFRRPIAIIARAAVLAAAGVSVPANASALAPAMILPQQIGGMLGFLGGRDSDDKDSALKDILRKELADAGTADVPLTPAQGDFEESKRDDDKPNGVRKLLRPYAPPPGKWSNVPGTAFDDVRLADEDALALGIHGTDGSRAVLTNNNGAAYDSESHVLYFWGGGASSYGGNEVYRLNLETLQAEQITQPSALTEPVRDGDGSSCRVPSDGPAASATQDGIVWSEVTQSLFIIPTDRFCSDGSEAPQSIWEFSPLTGTWSAVGPLGALRGPVAAEYDRTTEKVWVVTAGAVAALSALDPLTGAVSDVGELGVSLESVGSAVMRGDTGELLLLAREGIFAIPVAEPGSTRHLGDLPAEIDPRVGLAYDATLDRLVLWGGDTMVRTFDLSSSQWQTFAPPSGPDAAGAVLSKWVFIPAFSIFAGYHDPAEGLWLYRLPANLSAGPPSNRAPVAFAGPDETVPARATFHLSGANSFDADHDTLTFAWQIVQKPAGSTASIANTTASHASLLPDLAGQYVIRLTVSDGRASDSDTVTISAINGAPTARAGSDRRAPLGTSVQLDGGDSFDSNNDSLSYTWTLVSKPSESSATLQNASTTRPTLMLDAVGAFVLQLMVSDGITDSAPDTIRIEAVAHASPVGGDGNPGDLAELSAYVPERGAWTLVPNTAFNLVRLSNEEAEALGIHGSTGPRSVLTAWNGAAFDADERTFYFFGGGHGNYGGNEVYSLNLETLELRRRNDPAPLTDRRTVPGMCAPQRGPAAGHTYSGFVWSPVTKSAFQFQKMGYATKQACPEWWVNWIAEFDPETNDWTRVSPHTGAVPKSALNQAISYPMCGASDVTGLIYCLNGQGHANLYVYDPARREMRCRSQRETRRFASTGAAFYHDGYLYFGGRGIRRIPVDHIDGRVTCEFQEEQVAPEIGDLGPSFGFQIRDGVIYAWDGDHRVWTWTIGESEAWTTVAAARDKAPKKFRGKVSRVLSKWVYLPDLDVFAGYDNPDEGLWLYRAPTATQVRDMIDAAKAEAEALGYECSDDVSGWACPDLQDAIDATPAGGTLVLKKGVYNQCARIDKRITLDGNGSVVKEATCDDKGTLILRREADGSTIMNLECRNVFRCVRRQVPSVTLRNVYFHHSANGLQGHMGSAWGEGTAGYVGTITIEDSTFSHFGRNARHHAIYADRVDQLIIRRSKFLCSREGDHEIKTGARRTLIEDTIIDSQDCVDSRAVDAFNGGELIIRRSTLIEGLNSENRQIIGYNWEKRVQFPVARVEVRDSAFVCNKTASVLGSGTPGPSAVVFENNSLTGSCINVP